MTPPVRARVRLAAALLFLLAALPVAPAGAEPQAEDRAADDDDSAIAEPPTPAPRPARRLAPTLEIALSRIARLEAELASLGDGLEGVPASERADRLAEMRLVEAELERGRGDLARLITGLDPAVLDGEAEEDFAWEAEARELLAPVVSQLKQVTVRPRRIEQLRGRLTGLNERLPEVVEAIVKTSDAVERSVDARARAELVAVRDLYIAKKNELERETALLEAELRQLRADRSPLLQSGRAMMRVFFKSRGRNALMALSGLLLVVVLARLLQQAVGRAADRQKSERRAVAFRLVELVILLGGVVAGAGVMIGVLYAAGDWVLLTLAIVAVVALLWSTRNGLPRFWREIQVLLNVGPVRQDERVIWDGLPWRVASLNLVTVLESPAFPGTRLRLPLASMLDCWSRPIEEGERWFPTEIGDWVVWDGAAARVLHQSPDSVRLLRDCSELLVPSADFLAAAPVNLSRGFRHRVTVTFDYRHQKEITGPIPRALARYVEEAIRGHALGEHLTGLSVDFEAASSSSLDVEIEADFAGPAAARWEGLNELIHKAAVDACNQEGWEIALPQLTVHRAAE